MSTDGETDVGNCTLQWAVYVLRVMQYVAECWRGDLEAPEPPDMSFAEVCQAHPDEFAKFFLNYMEDNPNEQIAAIAGLALERVEAEHYYDAWQWALAEVRLVEND